VYSRPSTKARLCRGREESYVQLALALILLLLLLAARAFGDSRGVSWLLQMCSEKTDCHVIQNAYKNAPETNAGWLYLTSNGDRCKCAPKLLADPRPKKIRVHICNSTCFPERGRTCEPQECFAGMTATEASRAVLSNDPGTYERVNHGIAIAQRDLGAARNTTAAVSACMECTLTRPARRKLAEYVAAKFPSAQRVDNPINDTCLPGYLCEHHGHGAKADIVDLDGDDYDGIDQAAFWGRRGAWLRLAWKGCDNGLKKGDAYKPGVQRDAWCGSRDSLDFNTALAPLPATPTSELDKVGCKRWLKAPDGPAGFVLKLGEGRNYGVLLTPPRASVARLKRVELRHNGVVIDRSSPVPGRRFGVPYLVDAPPRRRIYDFTRHPHYYPNNSVLFADGTCWALNQPSMRID
jgi:hypothetical protein